MNCAPSKVKQAQSGVFSCPMNRTTPIKDHCPVKHCPYHAARVGMFFNVEATTGCALHEQELQGAPSLANLQKASIKKVSATTLRTAFNQALEIIKSKITLTNEIPPDTYCNKCGRAAGTACDGNCTTHKSWADAVLEYYGMVPNLFRRALVWKLVGKNQLFIPRKLAERK